MKKILCIIMLSFLSVTAFAKIKVQCDVIYERSDESWSNYHRCDVLFCIGEELGFNNRNSYAVIWFSQDNCAVIKLNSYESTFREANKYSIFIFLSSDILNQGFTGVSVNSPKPQVWKIYGKNESSYLIDPMFDYYPFNSYNEGVSRNNKNGLVVKRVRPDDK